MINSHILRGVSVVFAADIFGEFLKCIRGKMLVTLEHHVLEQMRETAATVRIILGTDVIPDLDRDRGAGVIFHRVDLQPVLERRMLEVDFRNRHRRRRRRRLVRSARAYVHC